MGAQQVEPQLVRIVVQILVLLVGVLVGLLLLLGVELGGAQLRLVLLQEVSGGLFPWLPWVQPLQSDPDTARSPRHSAVQAQGSRRGRFVDAPKRCSGAWRGMPHTQW